MTIRVLLVDDQQMVRAGFRLILDAEPDIEVVAEASDGHQAITLTATTCPDVVLMDIRMPNLDGIAATQAMVSSTPASRVIILTTFDDDTYVFSALEAGASGFLLKNSPPEELVAAIRVVASGDALLAPSVTRQVISEFARRPHGGNRSLSITELTQREQDVLIEVAAGLSNAEIAAKLFVSEGTVKTHVSRLLMKLSLRDRTQAVIYAYENGLVQPSR